MGRFYAHDMVDASNITFRLLRRPPDIALDVFVNEICFYRLERLAIEDFLMDEALVATCKHFFELIVDKIKLIASISRDFYWKTKKPLLRRKFPSNRDPQTGPETELFI